MGKRIDFTDEQLEWMRSLDIPSYQIWKMFCEKYNSEVRFSSFWRKVNPLGIGKTVKWRYTKEHDEWLKRQPVIARSDLWEQFKRQFPDCQPALGGFIQHCWELGLEENHAQTLRDRHYTPTMKGKKMTAEQKKNMGRTWYKKGNRPHTWTPIGSEREWRGVVYIKVKDESYNNMKNFMPKAKYIYEQIHGALPPGMMVIHLDGDNRNFDPDNLVAINRAEQAVINRCGLVHSDADITQLNLDIVRLNLAMKKKRK